MLLSAFLAAAAFAAADSGNSSNQSVRSNDNEFIFSQYPPRALAAGEQGPVKFRADIDEEGNVQACKVIASSGYARLDDETCNLIVEHAKFKPVLDSTGKARAAAHEGIVNWRIPGTVSTAKITFVPDSSAASDKVICKRVEKTGSLVSRSRVCMTAREWSQQADQYQEDYGAVQGRQGSSRGN